MSVILNSFPFLIPIQIYMCSVCLNSFPFLIPIQICICSVCLNYFHFLFRSKYTCAQCAWTIFTFWFRSKYTCAQCAELACGQAVTLRQISDPSIGIGNLPLQISDPCRRYLRIGSLTPRRECSITPRPVQLRVQHNTPAGAVSCSLTRCCTWISLQKIDSMLHTEAAAGAFSYLVLDSSACQLYS